MKKLNKALAMGLAAVCLLGSAGPVQAATKSVTSTYSGNLKSTSVTPATDVHMYGSALCTSGTAVGHVVQWSAKMWGSMAYAYTVGACSFGYNGSSTNQRKKTFFVQTGTFSYSEEAPMFRYYNDATTVLYY